MADDISGQIRKFVAERAGDRCEYCRMPAVFAAHRHEPDHIVPRQHGGDSHERNLAFCCMRCNRYKGPNIGSFDPLTGQLTAFFNPRSQQWQDHFRFDGAFIEPLSPEARVTVKILRVNDEDRLLERQRLLEVGLLF